MLRFVLPLLALMFLAASPSMAETTDETPPAAAKFKAWDSDGDGKLSATEWQGPQQRFQKLDGDGDGFVSSEEFSAAPVPPQAKGKSQSQQGTSCRQCNEQWHQCMVGKAGFLKQRCDEAMFRCEESCQK